MFNKHLKGYIGLLVSGLLTACATPSTHFYLLESQSAHPVTSTTMTKTPLIGIGPLSLPAVVDRKQIVTRSEHNSIQVAEFHQWAAPLKDNVLTVLNKNVTARQPNAMVKSYPWGAYGEMDYRVIIDISRFDSQLGKSANLEASWAIMEEKNHTIVSHGQTNLEQSLNDANYETVVQALSKLLNEFSQQLSLALQQLPKR